MVKPIATFYKSGFSNFFPVDPNFSIKILRDPKQHKCELVELHIVWRYFLVTLIEVVQNSFVVVCLQW